LYVIYQMAQKLFPILADPNAPSSFDGLDISLSAGQITANDSSSNRIAMTAVDGLFQTSLVLPKNSSLSTVELQFNNDGNSTASSLSSEQMFINAPNRDVLHLTGSLAEISDENTLDQNRTTIRKDKVQVVNTAGGTKTAYIDAENVNMASGADTVNMTASTLTANGVSASWADIVDGAVNPPPTPTLQLVLDAGNSANGANASISLLGGVADADTSVLTNDDFTMVRGEFTSVLTASESTFSNATFSTNLSMTGVYAGEIGFSSTEMTPSVFRTSQGASINQYTSDGLLINVAGYESSSTTGVFTNLQLNNLQVNDATHTTTVRPSQFTVLGQGALAGQMTELKIDRLQITNSVTDVNSLLTNGELSIADASSSATMSPASLVLASASTSMTISPSLSTSAGGSTDQYLVVSINGTAYRISLLAPP
jgi:hypothetical protein